MSKRYSATAIHLLKEALCSIYWYKTDLKDFLRHTVSNRRILERTNWDAYKRQIASDVVDILLSNEQANGRDLERLFEEVSKFGDYGHLEKLEDGRRKAQEAKRAVEALRNVVGGHLTIVDEAKKAEERSVRASDALARQRAVAADLDALKARFFALVSSAEAQKRGFELEAVMYDLFRLFDLDPKASFKNVGEQIDGAFRLEGTDYLFEGKWQAQPVDRQDLDAFGAKVQRKLDNTLGLFLSVNGFAPTAVSAHSVARPVLLLADGEDLTAVLEGRLDFIDLLRRKRSHAAHTGNIFLRVKSILSGV